MPETCRICQNAENNRRHTAREMMFGLRERFEYLECGACGTLQLIEIPDLARFYPADYYSLSSAETGLSNSLKSRLTARFTASYFLHGRNFIGKYLSARKVWTAQCFPASLRESLLKLNFHSRLLDFGCGAGKLLQTLHYFGFRNLTGADAFIEKDLFYPNGVRIFKKSLTEIEPFFDLVMLHHSFEHLPDPLETLTEIRRLLPAGKFCLIRIPLASFAWEKYGVNWVQLDAPRHLFLFTERSFRRLAEKTGFRVEKVVYDSEAFQFWASEQYMRDIPLHDKRAFAGDFSKSIFTEVQISSWEREAERLNAEDLGDQACFYLRKVD